MKNKAKPFATLEPESLSAFVTGLGHLPEAEIARLKRLYLLQAVDDFETYRAGMKSFLIATGLLSVIPLFLLVFLPALVSYRRAIRANRRMILAALQIWGKELGADSVRILNRLNA